MTEKACFSHEKHCSNGCRKNKQGHKSVLFLFIFLFKHILVFTYIYCIKGRLAEIRIDVDIPQYDEG